MTARRVFEIGDQNQQLLALSLQIQSIVGCFTTRRPCAGWVLHCHQSICTKSVISFSWAFPDFETNNLLWEILTNPYQRDWLLASMIRMLKIFFETVPTSHMDDCTADTA